MQRRQSVRFLSGGHMLHPFCASLTVPVRRQVRWASGWRGPWADDRRIHRGSVVPPPVSPPVPESAVPPPVSPPVPGSKRCCHLFHRQCRGWCRPAAGAGIRGGTTGTAGARVGGGAASLTASAGCGGLAGAGLGRGSTGGTAGAGRLGRLAVLHMSGGGAIRN